MKEARVSVGDRAYENHKRRIEDLRRLSSQLANAARVLEMGDRPKAREMATVALEGLGVLMRWWASP